RPLPSMYGIVASPVVFEMRTRYHYLDRRATDFSHSLALLLTTAARIAAWLAALAGRNLLEAVATERDC
ncbi:hypothetical protein, partial [Gemmatimonas sp.]|uniref:hypothetical protein n=1 Tax=Gemmatimonas sp. TaxID=1962908 RepID=UPI00398392D3